MRTLCDETPDFRDDGRIGNGSTAHFRFWLKFFQKAAGTAFGARLKTQALASVSS
jgi:hypothetical protein